MGRHVVGALEHQGELSGLEVWGILGFEDPLKGSYSLHCSSFLGLPFRTLNIE